MNHDFVVSFFILINGSFFIVMLTHKMKFTNTAKAELIKIFGLLHQNTPDEKATPVIREFAEGVFKEVPPMHSLWKQYKDTLVEVDPVSGVPICATSTSENVFNIEGLMRLSRSWVSFSLWNAVPQILTSIGIIGTFATIMIELQTLPPKISDDFINSLVQSLARGFWSSLIGVLCAVLFLGFERFNVRIVSNHLHAITDWLDSRFPVLTSEKLMVEQSYVLRNLSADISASISRGFSEMTGSLGPALADVLDDETKKTIKEGVASSFAELNTILVEIRNETKHLTEEMIELRASKRVILDNVKEITEEQKKIQIEINVQSSKLAENLKVFEQALAPLTEVAKQVHATNELSEKLIQSVIGIDQASQQIRSAIERNEKVSSETIVKFSEQLSRIGSEYGGLVSSIEGWVDGSNKSLENNLEKFDESIAKVMNQVLALSNSLNTSVISMERSIGTLSQAPSVN